MTVISLAGFKAISVISDPISLTSSSFTIFITICPGFRPFKTSCPTALSCTELINCFTTLKLTSASSKAILTSLSPAFTSASDRRPFPVRFLNTFCSLSARLSKAIRKTSCPATVSCGYSLIMSLEISPMRSIKASSPVSLNCFVSLWISATSSLVC